MIAEMQALPFPRATIEHIHLDGLPSEKNEEYVRQFLPMNCDGKRIFCICGEMLSHVDPLMGVLMGATFVWGIQHGHGRCCKCGWPTQMFHEFEEGRIMIPLQFHPDELTLVRPSANTKSA